MYVINVSKRGLTKMTNIRRIKTKYEGKSCYQLWEKFHYTPINDNDDIEEPFLFFEKGTDRFEVIEWFEEYFDGFIAGDNMT